MGTMDNSLDRARKQQVARRTDMILKGRFSLSNIENKAISYLISKVKPTDQKGEAYLFNCKEFQSIMRWSPKNSYNNTKGMLNRLADKGWWIETEENGVIKESYVHWITVLHMYPGTGNVVIKFHEDMFPYILDLTRQSKEEKKFFLSYDLENIALMGHEYSSRVYDILKTYQFNHKSWIFEFGTDTEYDLRRMIAHYEADPKRVGKSVARIPKGWDNFGTFKRDVLEPAKTEINEYTDIKIDFEGLKTDARGTKYRKVVRIQFVMLPKTEGEKIETRQMIDSEYALYSTDNIVDEQEPHQMTMEEAFFEQDRRQREMEARRRDAREKAEAVEEERRRMEKREAEINDCRSPLLADLLYDFLDGNMKNIDSIFFEACMHLRAGQIAVKDRDPWAVQYVTHYFRKITETRDATRTTVYNRLLDAVSRDYDGIADKIVEFNI